MLLTQGLRAKHPNEYWQIDATVIRSYCWLICYSTRTSLVRISNSCPELSVLIEVIQSVFSSIRNSDEKSLPDITPGLLATMGRLVRVEPLIS